MYRRILLTAVPVGGVLYALTSDRLSIFNKQQNKYKIVMVRHGESEGNHLNVYCGWFDTELSEKGKREAIEAGKAVRKAGMKFDIAHTSVLSRANLTLDLILKESGQEVPVQKTWRLNERSCGALTGMNKDEVVRKFGEQQVQSWAQFQIKPPPFENDHKYFKIIVNYPIYKTFKEDFKSQEDFPRSESIEQALKRFLPHWNEVIIPQLKEGKKIIIVAHGLLLKGIAKHLANLSDEEFTNIKVPNAVPFILELDHNFKAVGSIKYLKGAEAIETELVV